VSQALQSFLLAFSALFSIINPIGGALIFAQVTAERPHADRVLLARRIGLYASLVMLGALWMGAAILSFFGISLAALRIAGGLVVAFFAWQLLQAPEEREGRKEEQALGAQGVDDVAFFPLTMPFTTGPGTISVAIALGANFPSEPEGYWPNALGATAAAIVMAVFIWLSYASADRIVALLGQSGARVVARLAAFILLCVGVQIMLSGTADFVRSLAPTLAPIR
jgi:multiple antibiotic resistance protein